MRIFDLKGFAVFAVIALACAGGAVAEDELGYESATEAYRIGLKALNAGNHEQAIPALSFAADEGVIGAELELAQMYRSGEGVAQSDAKAFRYYGQVADRFAEISPRHPVAPYVSQAFIALGDYYRSGVAELKIEPDSNHAIGLYRYAASYLGDPEAQYKLAKMYLAGEGGAIKARLAVNWLANASKKNHAPSQALLGDLLWRGAKGVRRRPIRGLALMKLARNNAAGTADAVWIEELYEAAAAEAKSGQRGQVDASATPRKDEASDELEISNVDAGGGPAADVAGAKVDSESR